MQLPNFNQRKDDFLDRAGGVGGPWNSKDSNGFLNATAAGRDINSTPQSPRCQFNKQTGYFYFTILLPVYLAFSRTFGNKEKHTMFYKQNHLH